MRGIVDNANGTRDVLVRIPAHYVAGVWVVHHRVNRDEEAEPMWSITHAPTGLQFPAWMLGDIDLDDAIRIVNLLHDLRIPAPGGADNKPSRDERHLFESLIASALEES